MIRVWTDNSYTGALDRSGLRGSTFVYGLDAPHRRAVSMTMPVRLASWSTPLGVAPIFEMNLPEGALRERLRLAFAKVTGTFDDVDLLAIVGRSQLGRVRFTGPGDELDEGVPFQSIDEIISNRRGGELYRYLIEKFAAYSGISGVQPKFLVRDEGLFAACQESKRALSSSFRGATHIVKFWDPAEFPQLAANEFFCLKAAERCGLHVPPHRITEDGSALVMERFDLRLDGTYRGFEDFCVLNARRTDEKYRGSYETNVLKRFQQFGKSPTLLEESLQLFTLIVLNCAIRNGDAHLKNFGIVYENVTAEAHLAPVYDLVTTSVYIPQDRMALTLNGTNQWPSAKDLIRFGEARSLGTRRALIEVFERISDSLSDTARDIKAHTKQNREFAPVADNMMVQWEEGRKAITVRAA